MYFEVLGSPPRRTHHLEYSWIPPKASNSAMRAPWWLSAAAATAAAAGGWRPSLPDRATANRLAGRRALSI